MPRPGSTSIMDYFAGYTQQAELFLALRKLCESLGPVRIEAMKSGISFATRYKFAWVWLPQRYDLHQPGGSLVLSFGLDRQIIHPRIKEAVNPYPQRWTHHVVIQDPADLDDNLQGWLAEAYRFSNRLGRSQRPGAADNDSLEPQ